MTTSCFDREDETFLVLINHEGQYSIWPHWKSVPGGWNVVTDQRGEPVKGTKKAVSDYIEQHWTDMRPVSLRKWMTEHAAENGATAPAQQ